MQTIEVELLELPVWEQAGYLWWTLAYAPDAEILQLVGTIIARGEGRAS